MLEFQKIRTMNEAIEDENIELLPRIKIKEIIKFNLSLAYFIILTFLIAKLILA